MTDFWQNRIVESGAADPQELAKGMNPLNWRGHPEAQRDALEEALDSIGFLQRVLVNRASGRVIDGHLRIELAVLKGQPLIPVDYVELTDDEEALALATLDAITEQAQPIADKLTALLDRTRHLTADKPGLAGMLAALKERAGVNGNGKTPPEETPIVDKAAIEKLVKQYGVEMGQVWQLGGHKLLCGDSTDANTVERLLAGERVTLVPTDPPYNVGIEYGETVDDSKIQEIYESFSVSWFRLWQSVSERQIVTPGYNNLACWSRLFEKPYHIGTWTKTNSMTRGHVSRFACYEPVLFYGSGWKRERHNDIFDFPVSAQAFADGEKLTAYHPCPKPLPMWIDLIENYSERDDLIGDSFLGSGTSLLACEQLGRRLRGCDIEPKYIAVAIHRWVGVTGGDPVCVSTGL